MELTGRQVCIPADEASRVYEARSQARFLAELQGMPERDLHRLVLVVSEMASNLVKHALRGAVMILRGVSAGRRKGVEAVALDRGPGMEDVRKMVVDGYSRAGTLGIGLGTMRRNADRFDLYSAPSKGTALLAQVWISGQMPDSSAYPLEIGVVCLPRSGEARCGDAWAAVQGREGATLFVIDGLGHGEGASDAAEAALEVFKRQALEPDSGKLMRAVHESLRHRRGAAAAVARIDLERETVSFTGVGNISGILICGGVSRGFVSHNGTLGYRIRKLDTFTYPWEPGCVLIMHTDGITHAWRFEDYPELEKRHPSLLAGVIYRDHHKGNDDCCVLVVKARERI